MRTPTFAYVMGVLTALILVGMAITLVGGVVLR
jgi:hypothetical protein